MIRASIILVGYNSWSDLNRCLTSVFAKIEPDIEVIVVDNHSSDGSAEKIPAGFPKVKLIIAEENLGFGGGNNLAVKEAQGKYLIFLNPDTEVTAGWIEPLLLPLEANPAIGMTTSKILQLAKPEKINACGNTVHISGLTLCRGMNHAAAEFAAAEYVNAISGAAFAISREYFLQLGEFDPVFFLYMEDTDLSLRCLLNGKTILYVPDSAVYHDYVLTFGVKKIYYQERNRAYMLLKNLKPNTRRLITPVLFFAAILTWGYSLMKGRRDIQNKREASAWIREQHGLIQEKYEQTQKLRKISDYQLLKDFGWRIDF